VSGVSKLSRITAIPAGRRLYRGLSGMLLPEAFWRDRDGRGFLGGVELGLMSTTADRDIAIQYSGLERRRAAVFEIQVSALALSFYPPMARTLATVLASGVDQAGTAHATRAPDILFGAICSQGQEMSLGWRACSFMTLRRESIIQSKRVTGAPA
jgi:hypothetical protein